MAGYKLYWPTAHDLRAYNGTCGGHGAHTRHTSQKARTFFTPTCSNGPLGWAPPWPCPATSARAHPGGVWGDQCEWSGSGRDRWSCQAACIAVSRRHAQKTDSTACSGAPLGVRVGAATNMCFERFIAMPRPPEARASFVPIVHHDVQHASAGIWSKSSSNGSRELSECACAAAAARVGSRRGQTYLHAASILLSSPWCEKSTAATGSLVVVRGARTTAHLSKQKALSIPTILRAANTLLYLQFWSRALYLPVGTCTSRFYDSIP